MRKIRVFSIFFITFMAGGLFFYINKYGFSFYSRIFFETQYEIILYSIKGALICTILDYYVKKRFPELKELEIKNNKKRFRIYLQKKKPEYIPILINDNPYFYQLKFNKDTMDRTIKECFNILYYKGNFIDALYSNLVDNEPFSIDECYWGSEPSKFNCIEFTIGTFDNPNSTVYVSEDVCFEYIKKACERFLELHPEHCYNNYIKLIFEYIDK